MKHRITVSLGEKLVAALDESPGKNRSEKVERLLEIALAAREQQRWVSELKAFYETGPDPEDRREDLEWQDIAAAALTRDD